MSCHVGWFIATASNEYSGIVSHCPLIKLYSKGEAILSCENSSLTENPIFSFVVTAGPKIYLDGTRLIKRSQMMSPLESAKRKSIRGRRGVFNLVL